MVISFKKKYILLFIVAIITICLIIGGIIIISKKNNEEKQYDEDIVPNEKNAQDIKDTTPPIIILDDIYIVKTGYEKDLVDVIMSADDIDPNPKREIIGDYNVNVSGEYNLTYKITDSMGNSTTKDFTLKVRDNYAYKDDNKIYFDDAINTYKTNTTNIGIDVSKWQEDIDWKKVKTAGVEFAVLRMGYQNGFDGEVLVDPYFEQNVKGCKENGIPFSIYFSSYAKSVEESKSHAKWIHENLKGNSDYKNLRISFDWENWSSFNKLGLSLKDINDIADVFMDTCRDLGYKSMLYGSKTYLNSVWQNNNNYPVWLANYVAETTYEGKYNIWQCSQTGIIDGVTGYVDIDIMY